MRASYTPAHETGIGRAASRNRARPRERERFMRLEHGKYARMERERRYWLEDVRIWTCDTAEPKRISDRYLIGTRLRLRSIRSPDGSTVYKLTQKIVPEGPDFSHAFITNTYLNRDEYLVLAALPAHEVTKLRYRYVYDGREYGIDFFHGNLRGLVLMETEFRSDEEMDDAPPPPFNAVDVSSDERFTGGQLAQSTWDALRRSLTAQPPLAPALAF